MHLPRAVSIPPRPPLPPVAARAIAGLVIPPRPPLPAEPVRADVAEEVAPEGDDPDAPLDEETPPGEEGGPGADDRDGPSSAATLPDDAPDAEVDGDDVGAADIVDDDADAVGVVAEDVEDDDAHTDDLVVQDVDDDADAVADDDADAVAGDEPDAIAEEDLAGDRSADDDLEGDDAADDDVVGADLDDATDDDGGEIANEDDGAGGAIAPREIEFEPDSDRGPDPEPEALAFVDIAAPLSAAEGEDDVLRLRSVVKSFGSTRAVDGIDLTVQAGSFYGIVGPNGAGKTTTLSMIAGLLTPDRGSIRVGGIDAAADPYAAKQLMGVLPDRLRTFDRLTGRQLLYYYGVLRGLRPAVVESRTADLARAFDLTDALGRVVSDYSAGMAKKVMLAGAMIHSPRLLVLDEPFEAVDPVSSAVILDILSTYVAHGGTVILSSHGMDLVERVCSRVAVIVAGQVLAEGSIDEVRGELTLEQRFVELAGGLSDVEGLEWLHTFSG